MTHLYGDALPRAEEYANRRKLKIEKQLGGGVDGVVLSTNKKSAIKSFRYADQYQRERDTYLRLQENAVENVDGFAIPRLIDFHDELLVVEMQIVSPPFVVDFAAAYLDSLPDYPPEVMEEWRESRRELFGEER